MSLLLIGGLLIVAAAAIIGAVLLSIGEQRTGERRNAGVKEFVPPESSQLVTRKLEDEPGLSRPNLPTTGEAPLPGKVEEQRLSSLNGQFHELAGELRTIHEQAWQLEQRLSNLTGMVDHLERSQSGQSSFEEESRPASGNLPA